ncbi:MAG: Flp family type IVb pilin [Candidatus Limnocylindrales bacterium]
MVTRFLSSEEGQGFVEYALILVLVAIVAIVALSLFGGQISTIIKAVAK